MTVLRVRESDRENETKSPGSRHQKSRASVKRTGPKSWAFS